ncbi:hypothetical protein EK21DRAFT_94628 [Setomelanomma holmii]|uniref:Uncharacterized protein n=1 Tax=Setomelanomma holmii TaxID=210430 RepID=A0A9P4GYH2_9PLEO|nr:hypothetical protein EK21DRAFT_94628 [Setomelanomma holmii]
MAATSFASAAAGSSPNPPAKSSYPALATAWPWTAHNARFAKASRPHVFGIRGREMSNGPTSDSVQNHIFRFCSVGRRAGRYPASTTSASSFAELGLLAAGTRKCFQYAILQQRVTIYVDEFGDTSTEPNAGPSRHSMATSTPALPRAASTPDSLDIPRVLPSPLSLSKDNDIALLALPLWAVAARFLYGHGHGHVHGHGHHHRGHLSGWSRHDDGANNSRSCPPPGIRVGCGRICRMLSFDIVQASIYRRLAR